MDTNKRYTLVVFGAAPESNAIVVRKDVKVVDISNLSQMEFKYERWERGYLTELPERSLNGRRIQDMRFFQNVDETLKEVERDLVEMGIDNWPKSMQNVRTHDDPRYQTKELVGYSFRIHNPVKRESIQAVSRFYTIPEQVVEIYCEDEIRDRLGFKATNPGSSWEHRPEVWRQFLNAEGKFDYTYSERLVNIVRFAREALQNDPSSRQAILQVFHPTDVIFAGGKKRIPCSMYYQFLIRPRAFHILYTMRSCDIYTHFGFDITLAIMLAQRMKESLNVIPHLPIILTMFIGSLHAYKKDYEPRGVF